MFAMVDWRCQVTQFKQMLPRSPLLLFLLFTASFSLFFKYWIETIDEFHISQELYEKLTTTNEDNTEIRVFNIEIKNERHYKTFTEPNDFRVENIKSRLNAGGLPEGISAFWRNLTMVMSNFDWKQHERFLNTFKQYKTTVDGMELHFLRISIAPPKGAQVVPLLLLHGFPGTYWDFFKIIPILSNPRRFNFDFGASKPLLFDVIVPSLPGFIFSEAPKTDIDSARLLIALMRKLGIGKYFIHGTEQLGTELATIIGAVDKAVWGVHLSNPFVIPFYNVKTALKSLYPFGGSSIWNYYTLPQFRPVVSSNFIATAVQDSPLAQCALIMQYWEIGSGVMRPLNELFTLDEMATVCYLYSLTDSLPSALKVMANREVITERFQLSVPTGILQTADAPWQSAETILKHQFRNVTWMTHLEKGGIFHSLQTSEALAADIFRFVEHTLL